MDMRPVDFAELIGVSGGILIVLVPIIGATIKFAAKPLVDSLIAAGVIGPKKGGEEDLARLSRRVLELEQEVQSMKRMSLPPVSSVESELLPSGSSRVRS